MESKSIWEEYPIVVNGKEVSIADASEIARMYRVRSIAEYLMENYKIDTNAEAMELARLVAETMDDNCDEITEQQAVEWVTEDNGIEFVW